MQFCINNSRNFSNSRLIQPYSQKWIRGPQTPSGCRGDSLFTSSEDPTPPPAFLHRASVFHASSLTPSLGLFQPKSTSVSSTIYRARKLPILLHLPFEPSVVYLCAFEKRISPMYLCHVF